MPGVPAEVYKTVIMGEQVVSKGRQGSDAANRVQVIAMLPCLCPAHCRASHL